MGLLNLGSSRAAEGDKQIKDVHYKNILKTIDFKDNKLELEINDVMMGYVGNKEEILDNIMLDKRIRGITDALIESASKYNKIPKKIIIYNKDPKSNEVDSNKEGNIIKNDTLFTAVNPRWSLEEVYMSSEAKENILTSLSMIKYRNILFEEWKLKGNNGEGRSACLNFWGSPGTGKSMAAEGVAQYLGKKLLKVNYSELESKYVGETPKNIKKIFEIGKKEDAVIVFDEADSFLGKRLTSVTQSADYGVNITRSVMLLELENYDGIVIFTTNLINNYDEAFKRRIISSIEFQLPDEEGREKIWDVHLPKELPLDEKITSNMLAKEFDNISGADIKDIVIMAAAEALRNEKLKVSIEDFKYAYKIICKRYDKDNSGIKVISEKISEEQYKKETSENI